MTSTTNSSSSVEYDEQAEAQQSSVSSLLAEVVRPRKKPRLLTTDSYLERLKTFSPSTYFAKPTSLSPIICAARGWSNTSTDMLECCHCHAKLAIILDDKLTPSQTETVTAHFQEQLTTKGHAPLCLFWDSSKEEDCPIPLFLADNLDSQFVALLEHPTPQILLLERANAFAAISATQLPSSLEPLAEKEDRALFEQVKLKVRAGKTAVLLALFGWTLSNSSGTTTTTRLECKLCLAELNKNPLTSHKYYCPLRCGFGGRKESSLPCWKTIAKNIITPPAATANAVFFNTDTANASS